MQFPNLYKHILQISDYKETYLTTKIFNFIFSLNTYFEIYFNICALCIKYIKLILL